jgi:hypothetical protein
VSRSSHGHCKRAEKLRAAARRKSLYRSQLIKHCRKRSEGKENFIRKRFSRFSLFFCFIEAEDENFFSFSLNFSIEKRLREKKLRRDFRTTKTFVLFLHACQ